MRDSFIRLPFAFALLVACSLLGGCKNKKLEQEVAALSGACNGTGIAEAAAYTSGPGAHRLRAVKESRPGNYGMTFGRLHTTTAASDLAHTELVMCIDNAKDVEVGRCRFDQSLKVGVVSVPGTKMEGPEFPRVVVTQRVRVVAAKTGAVIAEKVFQGSDAPSCNKSITGHPSASDFRGGDVSDREQDHWAESVASSD